MLESTKTFNENVKQCSGGRIASDLVVAVITVCSSLGTCIKISDIFYGLLATCKLVLKKTAKKRLNVSKMIKHFEENIGIKYGDFIISYSPNSKKIKNKKINAFYNCLGISYFYTDINNIKSKIVSKIFPNGSISIPGCRTIEAVHNAPIILYDLIKKINEKHNIINNIENYKLRDTKIVMINSNFIFKRKIYQEKLKDELNKYKFSLENNKNLWRITNFQPEKYSGVNIRYITKSSRNAMFKDKKIPSKINGQISIFVFRSGKGTITGAKNTEDLKEAYKEITSFVRKNKNLYINE